MSIELIAAPTAALEALLLEQRPRLVRLCAFLGHDPDAADDLAQETLIEAWRHYPSLRDPAALDAWRGGIARNVCLRWRRWQAHEQRRLPAERVADEAADVADPFDLEVELERTELATLLDWALALLPPETRAVLVQRYVAESSHAEIARLLQLSEGAVAMRLQRGKVALRRVLTARLGGEAAAYGIATPDAGGWQQTRLWCPLCGEHQLSGRPYTAAHSFELICPGCGDAPGGMHISSGAAELLSGIRSLKAAYSRFCGWTAPYLGAALADGAACCPKCGAQVQLHQGLPGFGGPEAPRGIAVRCERCGSQTYSSLNGLTLVLPQVRQFWREHPRVRTLPARPVSTAHGPALLTRVESRHGSAALDVLHHADTLQLLALHHSLA